MVTDDKKAAQPTPIWLVQLPNQLSLFRMAAVPILLLLYPFGFYSLHLFCALLFALAAFTDWADGYIARRYQVESRLGAMLDPIADKMLTAAALVLLASSGVLWAWLAGVLLCREIALMGLRLVASQQSLDIEVSQLAKWKTLVLDVALVCLLVNSPLFGWPFREVGMLSIWVALALSLWSAYVYVCEFWRQYQF